MDWPSLIEKFGLAYTLLFGLITGLVCLIRWMLHNMAIPIRDALLDFLKDLRGLVKQSDDKLEKINATTETINAKVDGLSTFMGKLTQK